MFLRGLFVAIMLIGTLMLESPAWAVTRYVDATAGTCSGNYSIANRNCTGSDGNSYATPAAGLAALVASDVLDIRAGTYVMSSVYGDSAAETWGCTSGCPTSWDTATTIQNHPGEAVVLQTRTWTMDSTISTGGVAYLIVQGDTRANFIIEHSGSVNSESGIRLRNSIHHVRFQTITVRNFTGNGGFHTGTGETGRKSFIEIIDCEIASNGDANAPNGDEHGIYLVNIDDLLIERNYIHGNWVAQIHLYSPTSNSIMRATIRYNRIGGSGSGSANFAVVLYTGSGHKIHNNVVVGTGGEPVGRAFHVQSTTGTQVYNNTTYNTTSGVRNSATGTLIRNNIFASTSTPVDLVSGSITASNNWCHVADGDAGCIGTGAPGFVTAGTNFALTSSSGCIDAGSTATGLAYNGSAPDCGAFETFGFSSATINATFLDVTASMNLNTPVLPAAGPSGWSVGCTGGANCGTPTILNASRLAGSDSIVRLQLTGLGGGGVCEVGQTWTVTNSGSGNVTDSSLVGNVWTQPMKAFTTQPVTNNCGTAPPTPPPGLHIHYKMNDGAGTNLNDETANNLDGTASGTYAWGTGMDSTGITLTDATSGGIAVPYGSGVNPSTQSLTIAFWVNVPANLIASRRTYFGTTLGTNQRLYISGGNGGTWRIGVQSSSDSTASNLSVAQGWSRLCLVMDSGADTATLMVNGVTGTTGAAKTYTSYTLPANFTIGTPFVAAENPGVTYDDFKLWTSAESCADDWAAAQPPSPPASGTISQVSHQWNRLRQTSGGAAETYGAVSATMPVMVGGAVSLMIQTDCTAANCSSFGARLYFNVDGGAFSAVPDTMGASQVEFFTSPDSDVFQSTATCCLSGALTPVNGSTNTAMAAVPINTLAQNSSVTQRYVIRTGATTAGQTICFKAYDQNGNALSSYTPSAGACMTVVGVAGAMGF